MQKALLTTALAIIINLSVNAQPIQTLTEARLSPTATEIQIGYIYAERKGGEFYTTYSYDRVKGRWDWLRTHDDTPDYKQDETSMFSILYADAISEYGITNPNFLLRDYEYNEYTTHHPDRKWYGSTYGTEFEDRNRCTYDYVASAQVVIDSKSEAYKRLPIVIDKVMGNVREGSRVAIDQVSVWNELNKDDYKDKVIDVMLDKAYKVVAKEYLEKLYEEQLDQQSGIYNGKTIVKENNFSAIGYYLSINVTKTFIKAQLVNVSTGEYEGSVIECFDMSIKGVDERLSQTLNKALRNVREGSRLAIDQVSVPYSVDKNILKDQLIIALLDKGYKVIAKEYLERLYEEQQNQQSGIYNDKTTVQTDNFSAVGYYINVKFTETSLRVQVVNVSTGEYEGNATLNF